MFGLVISRRLGRLVVVVLLAVSVILVLPTGVAAGGDLVLHLPMDEGTGSTAGDVSGYGNDGTIYGPTWVTHDDGYALSFDGEDDYVDCGNPTALQFGTGDGTIEFWAQRKDSSSDYFSPNMPAKMDG